MKQNLFIPRYVSALLYKELESGGLKYTEGPRLLTDFYVGCAPRVGSLSPRTFGSDWWGTSNVASITEIKPPRHDNRVLIYFRTLNTNYVLEVDEKYITYRDDLNKLIELTQTDIDGVEWLKEAKAFNERVTNEYEEQVEEGRAKRKAEREATDGTIHEQGT